jgi:hypothetical protein
MKKQILFSIVFSLFLLQDTSGQNLLTDASIVKKQNFSDDSPDQVILSSHLFRDGMASSLSNGHALFDVSEVLDSRNQMNLNMTYAYETEHVDTAYVSLILYKNAQPSYREDYPLFSSKKHFEVSINPLFLSEKDTFRIAIYSSGYHHIKPNSELIIGELKLVEQGSKNSGSKSSLAISNDLTEMQLDVFPSPTTGAVKLIIEGFQENLNHTLEVLDLSGRMILKQPIKTSLLDIDLSHESAGVYLIRVSNAKKRITKQLFKTN